MIPRERPVFSGDQVAFLRECFLGAYADWREGLVSDSADGLPVADLKGDWLFQTLVSRLTQIEEFSTPDAVQTVWIEMGSHVAAVWPLVPEAPRSSAYPAPHSDIDRRPDTGTDETSPGI